MRQSLETYGHRGPRARRFWITATLGMVLSFFALFTTQFIGVIATVLLLVAAVQSFFLRTSRGNHLVLLLIVSFLLWYSVLIFRQPSALFEGVVLGLRSSLTFFVALLVGINWPLNRRSPLFLGWFLILGATLMSLVVFLYFPELEQAVERRAGIYTSLYAGEARLQGIWPGPFHASMAGSFLVLCAFTSKVLNHSRLLRILSLSSGIAALFYAQVRVGIVATLVGLMVLFVVARGSSRLFRILGITLIGLIAFLAIPLKALTVNFPALHSLFSIGDDTRFLGRFDRWGWSIDAFLQSPILGWGCGSATATLGQFFQQGTHVTPHNFYLKYAVEAGIVGLILVVAIFAVLITRFLRAGPQGVVGLLILVILFTFSITDPALEELPVTLVFGVLLGVTYAELQDIDAIKMQADKDIRSTAEREHSTNNQPLKRAEDFR